MAEAKELPDGKADSDRPDSPPPPIPAEVLAKLPPEDRERIEAFFATAMSWGPAPHPLTGKVTSEHIGQMIQAQAHEMELEFADRKDSWRFATLVFLASAALVVFLIVGLAWAGKSELLNELVKLGAVALGGIGGGYGFSEWRRRRQ